MVFLFLFRLNFEENSFPELEESKKKVFRVYKSSQLNSHCKGKRGKEFVSLYVRTEVTHTRIRRR